MTTPSPSDLVENSAWLLHRYDDAQDMFQFKAVSWEERRRHPFLSEEALQGITISRGVKADAFHPRTSQRASVHFIFHSAFCASTLLTKVLGHGGVSSLSEPQVLNDLIGALRRGKSSVDIAKRLDASLGLLARPEPGKMAVLIKPSNLVNHLAHAMLALRPEAKAVFLYAPLRIFLGSVARKGLWCRLWVRELLEYQTDLGMIKFGFSAKDYLRLTDLQVAAIGWLAQYQLFRELESHYGAARLYFIDSETLTQQSDKTLDAVCTHFGLWPDAMQRAAVLSSPDLKQHSKFGHAFSSETRLQEGAVAEASYADEIGKVEEWARAVARSAGIAGLE